MHRLTRLALTALAALGCSFAASADALHGFCPGCMVDNMIGGTPVTSTTANPLLNFGFWSGGKGLNGAYTLDILTPDNGGAAPTGTYAITGGASGTASLFSSTAWTTGFLDSYLGIDAQPHNPLSAWLPATKTFDSGAMGYWVFQASLGTQTLGTKSGAGPLLNIGSLLPQGSVIVAFLSSSTGKPATVTATANSSALFEAGVAEPGTLALMAAGFAGLIASLLRRRRPRVLTVG
jgi:hypothetical protein